MTRHTLNFIPPTKSAQPKTSNRFDKTEPSKETRTSCILSFVNAIHATIISVTLPNVAFNKPPNVSFVCAATPSVKSPKHNKQPYSSTNFP